MFWWFMLNVPIYVFLLSVWRGLNISVHESPFTLKHSDAPEGGLAEGTDSCISWLLVITYLTLNKAC